MPRFRKKPVVIEAIQWTGDNLEECKAFLGDDYGGHEAERRMDGASDIRVYTLEGSHVANKGDWLIRGIAGEHYPCKPSVFDKTYEVVV